MDGCSLVGMDGVGCSAGRFCIHSAMASFMRGASLWPPREALTGARGKEEQRPEPSPPLGIMSQVRQVLRAGLASPRHLATGRGHSGK